ncbi:PAS domain-containing sensor histidine kinase [Ponticaulis sp.]|uniref:sensor histidine kinase n=1 Tax=Ponticaulis sp. TaxID=2020902 RepID=UPI0025DEDAB5|nr:PAS domain-containing sensor histidine kinase [Ponticaulis sp.]
MSYSTLSESEDQALSVLRAILDNTVDGLITIDDTGRILSVNKACEAIFGYTEAELAQQNVKILMPDPYRSGHDGYMANYHAGGEARVIGIGREVEGLRKDGSVFPLDLSVARVEVRGQVFYSGIVRDITVRKRAEEEILAKSAALERFAYVASHDLKEPLRAIEAISEILALDYADKLDEEGLTYLHHLTESAQRMRLVVTDVLEYSRLDIEQEAPEDFSAGDVVQDVLKEVTLELEQAGAVTDVASLPDISGSRIRFYRLMQNLIANSIKYRRKSVPLKLSIYTSQGDDEYTISVADNGIGMEVEYHVAIFDMFKRLHARHEYAGTGIGLAICKKIVEGWEGRIWVESARDSGSTFHFSLPKRMIVEA